MSELISDVSKSQLIRKLSWNEKFALCSRWKESGLSKSQFCREQKIAVPTFCNWCNKLWPSANKKTPTKLTPVRIINESKTEQQISLELFITDQTRVKIILPLSSIGAVIKELCYATTIIR